MATPNQLEFLQALMEQLNLEEGDVLAMVLDLEGVVVDALEDLTVPQASSVIRELRDQREEKRRRE